MKQFSTWGAAASATAAPELRPCCTAGECCAQFANCQIESHWDFCRLWHKRPITGGTSLASRHPVDPRFAHY
uniref:Uncharacterized protein n=1 Tax=Ixodes ricinus TaxID=34613 RepID=A0A6B0TSG9_IXORI